MAKKNRNCKVCNKLIWNTSTYCSLHGLLKSAKKRMKSRKSYKGKNNPNYRKGQKIEKGYMYIYSPKHPNSKRNYIKRATLIIEKYLRRYLKKEEVIHHKDGNKLNDNIKNLQLCKNKKEHKTIDMPLRDRKTGKFIKLKGGNKMKYKVGWIESHNPYNWGNTYEEGIKEIFDSLPEDTREIDLGNKDEWLDLLCYDHFEANNVEEAYKYVLDNYEIPNDVFSIYDERGKVIATEDGIINEN